MGKRGKTLFLRNETGKRRNGETGKKRLGDGTTGRKAGHRDTLRRTVVCSGQAETPFDALSFAQGRRGHGDVETR